MFKIVPHSCHDISIFWMAPDNPSNFPQKPDTQTDRFRARFTNPPASRFMAVSRFPLALFQKSAGHNGPQMPFSHWRYMAVLQRPWPCLVWVSVREETLHHHPGRRSPSQKHLMASIQALLFVGSFVWLGELNKISPAWTRDHNVFRKDREWEFTGLTERLERTGGCCDGSRISLFPCNPILLKNPMNSRKNYSTN